MYYTKICRNKKQRNESKIKGYAIDMLNNIVMGI